MKQKRLILLKTTQFPEVGHLYEHIYLSSLRRYFHSHRLYAGLDYHIWAGTYSKGIIYFTIYLYTPEAVQHSDILLQRGLDTKAYEQYTQQISLEENRLIEIKNRSKLNDELSRIDAAPWRSIDSLDVINAHDNAHARDILQPSDKPFRRSNLHAEITIDGEGLLTAQPELLALFHQVSYFILDNMIAEVCRQTSAYSIKDTFYDYGSSAKLDNIFYIYKPAYDIGTYTAIVQNIAKEVVNPEILNKVIAKISTSSYEQGDFFAPDDNRIYQETGLFVGGSAWKQFASSGHIEAILPRISIGVRLGKEFIPIENTR